MEMPKLITQGNKTILTVDGKPFVALAGEVHNSDYTSLEYMEGIWKIADDLGMNTLLIPMSWDIIEPEEGVFDFTLAKGLILQARKWKKKIGFLWFGSWKNAECMYAPDWVKMDLQRFQRGQIEKGKNKAGRQISPNIPFKFPYTTLSYLCREAMVADGRAFGAFLQFIKEFDSEEATVISVQVENETGLLGSAREVSDEADAAFAAEVPAEFVAYMKSHTDTMVEDVKAAVEAGASSGNWQQVFGPVAEEMFSAYHVASYVEYVAAQGKAAYPLPMTANCWLDKGGKPGSYPTGGPVSRVHEVWQYCAPSVDILSPDIYVPNFMEICEEYTRRGTPLYIPETATHSYAAPRMVYTVGHYHAICYAPFGFDDIGKPFSAIQGYLFGMDVTDPALKTPQSYEEYGATGRNLQGLMPRIGPCLGTNRLQAACGEAGNQSLMAFDSFRIMAAFQSQMQPRNDGYCLCVQVAENECYLMGNACSLIFLSGDENRLNLDFLLVEEGAFDEEGNWKIGRRLNGDETAHLGFAIPGVLHVKFFVYGDAHDPIS
jgi:hypothetical protein